MMVHEAKPNANAEIAFGFANYLASDSSDDLKQSDGIHCLSVSLGSLEASDDKEQISSDGDVEYFCQMMLFNTSRHKFLGNIWTGKRFSIKNGKALLNEAVYFYTSLKLENLLLSLEVAEVGKADNMDQTIAWSAFSLLGAENKVPGSESFIQYRVPLFHGTPIALLFMAENPERLNQAKNPSVFELSFSISSHPMLMRFLHLIPVNYLVGSSDSVVGVYQTKKDVPSGHDPFKRGQLQKCCTVLLGSINIKCDPSLAMFEAEILKKLSEEKELTDFSEMNGEMVITQRHLQIGVHNGLCYTQESDSYRLLVEPIISQGSVTHRSSSSSSMSFSRDEHLVVRSDVKIPNVPDDPHALIVFIIEYTLSCKDKSEVSSAGTSLGKSSSSSVTLLWGVCPLSTVKSEATLSVPLTSDPSYCPNKTLLLRVKSFNMTLVCSVLNSRKSMNYLSPEAAASMRDNGLPYSDSLEAVSVPSQLHQLSKTRRSFKHRKRRSLSHSTLNIPHVPPQSVQSQNQHVSSGPKHLENDTMEEVNLVPSAVPLVPPSQASSGQNYSVPLDLADYARLLSAKFPTVRDHQGNNPVTIDPSEPYVVNTAKESSMEGSKIVFQFLGFKGISSSDLLEMVYFKFRFYRFPSVKSESLHLKSINQEESQYNPELYILSSEKSSKEYGYQVAYHIDPAELSPGECKPFINSLSNGTMYIDVFNAKTLLYFGTAIVPLKYLCRQEREAVCATLTLDLMHMEFPDDAPGPVIPLLPTSKAHLFLKMSSIRMPLTANSLSKLRDLTLNSSQESKVSQLPDQNVITSSVLRPSPILETNKELSTLMASRCLTLSKEDASLYSEERKRKLARMEAVRNSLGETPLPYSKSKDIQNYFKERQRDLAVIESYIEKNKSSLIQDLLQASVTCKKILHAVMGEKLFFKFSVSNPHESDQIIQVASDCPELKLVVDSQEIQYLSKHRVTSIEGNVPVVSSKGASPTIFLHAKKTMQLLFSYYKLCHPAERIIEAPSGSHFTCDLLKSANLSTEKDIKVQFRTQDDKLLAALSCKVLPLPPSCVSHVFKFLCPEHSVFTKTILIRDIERRPLVHCSDPKVTCELHEISHTGTKPFTLTLKALSGPAGRSREFFLYIYTDLYMLKPVQVWAVHVSVVQRIDLTCIAGQATHNSIVVRGDHSSRLVCCFTDSSELTLNPSEPFILSSCSIQEVSLTAKCLHPGVGYFRVSLVDQNLKELIQSWLLVISCQKPLITKAFQVKLNRYKEAVKRVTISNPSSDSRHYEAFCSHPHVLHLRELKFVVPAKSSYSLGLYFLPQESVLNETIFLYLSDDERSSLETFCIEVSCG